MNLDDVNRGIQKRKRRNRLGRGPGSGHGKTCGRGHKGVGQRAGGSIRRLTEGGQMPLFRRIPKRGFSNAPFRTDYDIVNVCDLDELFSNGDEVTKQTLVKVGLLRNDRVLVKILGDGDLAKKLTVLADRFSKSAKDKITAAGGTISEIGNSK